MSALYIQFSDDGHHIRKWSHEPFDDAHRYSPPEPDPAVHNPKRWFHAPSFDSEWWSNGGETRDECIAAARQAHGKDEFWIVEAKRMLPSIETMNLFDGEDIVERMQDDEAWGEDGWEGAGDTDDLTSRLTATLDRWFNETCSLDGAQLDFTHGPEQIQSEQVA